MLIHQLGHKFDETNVWVIIHFLHDLDKTIRDEIFSHLQKKDILNNLIKKIDNIIHNVEFDKNLDESFCSFAFHSSNASLSRSYNSESSSDSIKSISAKSRIFIKIIDVE